MKTSIIVSKEDIAGMNMAKFLKETFGFKETEREFDGNNVWVKDKFELVFVNEFQIYAEHLNNLETDLIVFASRHSSAAEKPSLTVHAPGNWGKAEMGGKDGELCPTYAGLIKNYLLELQKKKDELNLEYEVSLETTHHGPFLEKPAVFIELGSCEKQWGDLKAAEIIAGIIFNSTKVENAGVVAIGIGGNHYCPEFTKLVLRTDYATSHIIPKYILQNFSEEMLGKAIEKTVEKVDEIVIDYKGLGLEKKRVLPVLEKCGLPIKRVRKLL
ncbi:MAG: D-aminoacyl-tRNA deacylase [Candidatus Diapherotrites archaeon]